MKKRVILLTIIISAFAGGATACLVSSFNNKTDYERITNNGDSRDFHLVDNPSSSQNVLPDFTQAAEKGVKSVVNVDIIKRVQVDRGYGGYEDMDPFELFFGNPQRQRQPRNEQQPQFREQKGGGSGVIISTDGYIVTNNHVVSDADQIKVTTHTGDYYTAKVVGTDPDSDIALLKIEAQNLPVLEFGNSDELRLGEWVLAIGNPFGLTSTVTQGIISAKGRSVGVDKGSIDSYIQTDAVVNRGNSGGALITLDGRLIGINTMIFSPTGSYSGYSFAVPSSIVRKVVSDLREHGVVQRAMLGIQMGEINAQWLENFGKEAGVKERGGLYIGEVLEGGSAEAAGIKKGDVLIAIDGKEVNTAAQVQETIGRYRPNDKVKISVKRDGAVKHFEVTLRNKAGSTAAVTKPTFDLIKELGARFRDITENQKNELKIKYGVQVVSLDEKGILAKTDVKPGFVVTAINNTPIMKVSELETMNIAKVKTIDCVDPQGVRIRLFAMEK